MRSWPTNHRFPGDQRGANSHGQRPLLPLMGQPTPYMQQHNFPSQMRNIRPLLPNHNIYPSNQMQFQTFNPSINNPSMNNPFMNNPSMNNPSMNNFPMNNPSMNNFPMNNPAMNRPSMNNFPMNNSSMHNPSMSFSQANTQSFNFPGPVQRPVRNAPTYKSSNVGKFGTNRHFKDAVRKNLKSRDSPSITDTSTIDIDSQSNHKSLSKSTSANSPISAVTDSMDQELMPDNVTKKINAAPLPNIESKCNGSSGNSNNLLSASQTSGSSLQNDVNVTGPLQESVPKNDDSEHPPTLIATSTENIEAVSVSVPSKPMISKTNPNSSDRTTKRVKCKIHSHKPIPWPGSVKVKTEPKDTTATDDIIPLARIKVEPGTTRAANVVIKREPCLTSGGKPVISSRRNISKRNVDEVSGSGNSGSKVIKLERNNVISLRCGIPNQKETASDFSPNKNPDPLAATSIDNGGTDILTPNLISTTSLPKTVVSQSDGDIASSLSPTTSRSSTANTSSNLSNPITPPSISISQSQTSETSCPSTSTNTTNILSQTFDNSSNNADNFLHMIYNDLAQSIPLKLSNGSPPMSETQVAKLFGLCGNVLSVEPDLSTNDSPSKSLLVSVRGSVAGGLAVQLLHEATVGGQVLQVLPHTEKAVAAMQALPPEVLQSDVAVQCLEAIQNYFSAEGLSFLPSPGYRSPIQDDSSVSTGRAPSKDPQSTASDT